MPYPRMNHNFIIISRHLCLRCIFSVYNAFHKRTKELCVLKDSVGFVGRPVIRDRKANGSNKAEMMPGIQIKVASSRFNIFV